METTEEGNLEEGNLEEKKLKEGNWCVDINVGGSEALVSRLAIRLVSRSVS